MIKNKKIMFILLSVFSFVLLSTRVSALETLEEDYTEKFLEQASEDLKQLYEEQNFIVSSEWFDENGNLYPLVKIDTDYVATNTYYFNGKALFSDDLSLTKKEYYSSSNTLSKSNTIGNCEVGYDWYHDCWETTYKRLTLAIMYVDYPNDYNSVKIAVINSWKNMPVVRSYDTIGLYHDGNFSITNVVGYQYFKTSPNGSKQVVNYSYKGTNMKLENLGVSISQNIVDDVNGYLQNEMYVYGTLSKTMPNYYNASYQHAVNDIDLATSKNFAFAATGMGGVYKWNVSYDNWDNMKGVCANLSDKLWYCSNVK